ncbi:MAG: TRAP transporter large permease subunit, partial [Synergistaceae bacterium]|nr:TRAP transporter large permease subunit [Synergistaceae bacterium]
MGIGTVLLLFFGMLLIGTPISVCLANVGIFWILSSPTLPNLTFATRAYGSANSFSLMAIPFFMMAGQLMEQTGITEKFIEFSKSVVGHITGGVAHTAMVAGVIMAGVSGSGNADTAAIGSMMIPALVKD